MMCFCLIDLNRNEGYVVFSEHWELFWPPWMVGDAMREQMSHVCQDRPHGGVDQAQVATRVAPKRDAGIPALLYIPNNFLLAY